MIERVARAIATARAGPENAAESEFKAGNLWCEAKREARAAIEAMREPTEAMQEAYYDQRRDYDDHPSEMILHLDRYRAMIDAALGTETASPADG